MVEDAVEAKEEVKVKVKMEAVVKVVETTNNANHMKVFAYGRIVQVIEMVPYEGGCGGRGRGRGGQQYDQQQSYTHSSISICRLLLLLDKTVYRLVR